MKTIQIVQYVITIIGAGMLTGAFFIYKNTNAFLETATHTQGTVTQLLKSTRRSSSDSSITYSPVVQFVDKNGTQVQFTSSTSSNPPSFNVGENVEIFYNPKSPNEAKINSFFSLWGGVLILGIIGSVFLAAATGLFIFDKKKLKQTF